MADHDQRMKGALQAFLSEFVALLLPTWGSRFDFSSPGWLQQEMFLDPPHGHRREIDLVARLQRLEHFKDAVVELFVNARPIIADAKLEPAIVHTGRNADMSSRAVMVFDGIGDAFLSDAIQMGGRQVVGNFHCLRMFKMARYTVLLGGLCGKISQGSNQAAGIYFKWHKAFGKRAHLSISFGQTIGQSGSQFTVLALAALRTLFERLRDQSESG